MNNKYKDFNHVSSGQGIVPGFLAGVILTGALSIFLYQKDKGKTFGQIADKVEALISDYLNPNPKNKTKSSSKKPIDIPDEILQSAPRSKDKLDDKKTTHKPRTFTKVKK